MAVAGRLRRAFRNLTKPAIANGPSPTVERIRITTFESIQRRGSAGLRSSLTYVTLGDHAAADHRVLILACRHCPRRGRYRLAGLIDRFGADMGLPR